MADPGGMPRARYRPPDPRQVRVSVLASTGAAEPDLLPAADPADPEPPDRPAPTTRPIRTAPRTPVPFPAPPFPAPPFPTPPPARSAAPAASTGVGCAWGLAIGLVIGLLAVMGARPTPALLVPEAAVAAPAAGAEPGPAIEVTLGAGPLEDPALRVAPSSCSLPPMGVSNESLEAWVQSSVTCLDAVWEPVLRAAGVPHSRPVVQRFRDRITTTCVGDLWTNGFYCGADNLIGISPSNELATVPNVDRPGWLLGIMAHEYGHHLQHLSGTGLAAGLAQDGLERGGPAWLELSRRIELQANCLAGASFAALIGRGTVTARDAEIARMRLGGGDEALPGAPRDHGTAEHGLLWFDRGVQTAGPGACNTWTVPAAEVE